MMSRAMKILKKLRPAIFFAWFVLGSSLVANPVLPPAPGTAPVTVPTSGERNEFIKTMETRYPDVVFSEWNISKHGPTATNPPGYYLEFSMVAELLKARKINNFPRSKGGKLKIRGNSLGINSAQPEHD